MAKLLLLGVGRWGKNHLRVLRSLPIDLFVVDRDPTQLEEVLEEGVSKDRVATSHEKFARLVDAAVVVTPAPSHYELCKQFLELDKDVFVEKPLAMRSEEALNLVALAKERERVLQVGYIFRFDPATHWLRDAIRNRRLGQIQMIHGVFSGFKRPRIDTGVTLADGIHFVDLFNFLLDQTPEKVLGTFHDFIGRGMEDEAFISMIYHLPGGRRVWATVDAGYHVPGKNRQVTVVGDHGSAVCDYNVAQYKIKLFENRHWQENEGITSKEGAVTQLEFPPEEPLRTELGAFVRSIRSRKPPLADGSAGFESLVVVEKAFESALSGTWAAVQLERQKYEKNPALTGSFER